MPRLVKRLGIFTARCRIIMHRRQRIAVHHRLAGHQRHPARLRFAKQRIGTGLVHRAKGHGRRRAICKQVLQEGLGIRLGIIGVGIARLLRKGEARQPVQQILPRRGEHAKLRKMNMRINKTGHDDIVAIVIRRKALKIARQERERPAPQNRSVIANDNPALAFMGDLMMRLAETQGLPANKFRHGATRSSMRKRKMRHTWSSAMANSSSLE